LEILDNEKDKRPRRLVRDVSVLEGKAPKNQAQDQDGGPGLHIKNTLNPME
jgi:hypothetical protein